MQERPLTPDDIDHFIQYGFVKLGGAIDMSTGSPGQQWVEASWTRNGLDPDDPENWPADKIHMPTRERMSVREMAPRAWAAMAQLAGGEERLKGEMSFGDGFIANYGWGRHEAWQAPRPEAPGWHKDGDWFIHFLDSPEQGLLTVVYWSDVEPRGGGTFIAPDSVGVVARYLAAHPEGVHPWAFPKDTHPTNQPHLIRRCVDFREVTGKAGDVFILHPFMLHASSYNHLPKARLMTNPCIRLAEPMRFHRGSLEAQSPIERAILRGLGEEQYDFVPLAPRAEVIPPRVAEQRALKEAEEKRLAGKAG